MNSTDRKLRVFLCHASQDKPVVRELYQRLLAEGWIDPWLDEKRLLPGMDWDLEIEKAVEIADAVIVCLSKGSISKEGYVQKEIQKVLDISSQKPEGTMYIIPVRLDDCAPPRRLIKWQYIDYFPKPKASFATNLVLESLKVRANNLGIFELVMVMQICQCCHSDISKSQEVIQCDKCGAYYHRECWIYLGGCATLGCDNNPNTISRELRELERKAIQYELLGNWWDALQIYYKIKRIDPTFPRVEIKIDELEKEYSISKSLMAKEGGIRQNQCPHCGAMRSDNLIEPCPNCGSRQTTFGYRYPFELIKVRILATVAVGLTVLILITFAVFLAYWFPQLFR